MQWPVSANSVCCAISCLEWVFLFLFFVFTPKGTKKMINYGIPLVLEPSLLCQKQSLWDLKLNPFAWLLFCSVTFCFGDGYIPDRYFICCFFSKGTRNERERSLPSVLSSGVFESLLRAWGEKRFPLGLNSRLWLLLLWILRNRAHLSLKRLNPSGT